MNLSFPTSENTGGLEVFYFVPVEHIQIDSGDEVTLIENFIWNIGRATRFSQGLEQNVKKSVSGSKISIKLQGSIGKYSGALTDVLQKMFDKYFVVVVKDYNGRFIKLGSKEHPLKFYYSANSGKKPGSFAGIEFQFEGFLLEEPISYTGTLPTDGGRVNGALEVNCDPVTIDPVTIKWNDTVVAMVEGGSTIQFNSEFKFNNFKII